VTGDAADEVAGDAAGGKLDGVVAGLERGEGPGGGAGVVVRLAHLKHVVRATGVFEDCMTLIQYWISGNKRLHVKNVRRS
jgi:hypothetical protein